MKPSLRKAFLNAINDITQAADFDMLVRALENGDVDGAVRALRIGPEFYRPLENAIVDVYVKGGDYAVDTLPSTNPITDTQMVIRFGIQSLRAQNWLREQSSRLIAEITESQREAVRERLASGLSEGRNPRSVALDVVGRYNPKTKVRSGGVVGLGSRDAKAVDNYRRKLLEEGRDGDQVDRMAKRYASKLLRLRGERIARTETIAALNAGRFEAMEQAIEDGEIAEDAIKKEWSTSRDGRERKSHSVLHRSKVRFREAFQTINGSMLNFPGDRSLGALAKDLINCRCTFKFIVDWTKA